MRGRALFLCLRQTACSFCGLFVFLSGTVHRLSKTTLGNPSAHGEEKTQKLRSQARKRKTSSQRQSSRSSSRSPVRISILGWVLWLRLWWFESLRRVVFDALLPSPPLPQAAFCQSVRQPVLPSSPRIHLISGLLYFCIFYFLSFLSVRFWDSVHTYTHTTHFSLRLQQTPPCPDSRVAFSLYLPVVRPSVRLLKDETFVVRPLSLVRLRGPCSLLTSCTCVCSTPTVFRSRSFSIKISHLKTPSPRYPAKVSTNRRPAFTTLLSPRSRPQRTPGIDQCCCSPPPPRCLFCRSLY